MSNRGAAQSEWEHFATELGLCSELLPVVSDPRVPVSPNSTLRSLGKTPSLLDAGGRAVGIAKWPQKQSTLAEVAAWSRNPELGICVQTRLVRAIDIDVEDPVLAGQLEAVFTQALGALPCRSRPGTGKRLLVARAEGRVQKRRFRVEGGWVELLGNGQHFVAVGTHPSGTRYEWQGGLPTAISTVSPEQLIKAWEDVEAVFATAPERKRKDNQKANSQADAVMDFDRAATLLKASAATVQDLRSAVLHLPPEDADEYATWVSIGMALKSLDGPEWGQDVLQLWHEFSQRSGKYDPAEAAAKWASFDPDQIDFRAIFSRALKTGWVAPQQRPASAGAEDRTEAGSLEVLARLVDGTLRFVYERKLWIWWDGARWIEDDTGVAAQRCVLTVADEFRNKASVQRERLSQVSDPAAARAIKKEIEALDAWSAACRSRRVITNVLALATADSRFVISVSRLNANPWLLGVANGVVDLRDGALRENAREDFVTMRCPVAYEPGTAAPRWQRFITEVTSKRELGVVAERPELARYLQRFLGYCATGSTQEHKLFLTVGEGANGKNVLFDTMQFVLEPYCQTVPPEVLTTSSSQHDAERASPLLAGLAGARLAVCSESRDGQQLDVSLIKRHTGGGYMKARYLREDPFQFEITHKLAIMTNHRPHLDCIDQAVRGRLHLVPFDMRWNRPGHPARDPDLPDGDKALPQKLKKEAVGILAWLVEGAVAYCREGLEAPDCVQSYTREYLQEQDPFGRWLGECQRCDVRDGTRAMALLASYERWKQAHGEDGGPRTPTAFGKALRDARVAKQARSSGAYYGLRPPAGLQEGGV